MVNSRRSLREVEHLQELGGVILHTSRRNRRGVGRILYFNIFTVQYVAREGITYRKHVVLFEPS
jgi:hypothetical protein